jgi:hypothetical protein
MADEEELTTEESILDDIGESGNEDESVSTTDGSKATNVSEEAIRGTTETEGGGQTPSGSIEGQQTIQKNSGPQDLVGRDGSVIASGGRERRFYEAAQRGKQQVDTLTTQLTEATTRLKAFEDAGSIGNQYDLTPDEVTTGAQLISSYKNDPVETIKYLLTQAQASGHNIDTVGTTDMSAMKQMLDTAMKPFTDQRKAELDTQENNDRAYQVYSAFIAKFPDAAAHEDTIARLLNEDTSLSPEAAYFKLQSYYATKGLDWKKSLAVLQQEHANRQANGLQNTQQQLPDGNNVDPNRATDTAEVADVNTSTDDIIRQAMVEAGIN